MNQSQRPPDRIIRAEGREFHLYKVYDEATREYILDYPDFQMQPVYTAEGRPFALSAQEGCPHGRHHARADAKPYDCSECAWFSLQAPPNDAIGVCRCDALMRREQEESRK